MVFGAFGEMSRDTYTLLDQLAEAGATKYEGDMLCASRQHAKGVLRYLMRSSWYFAAVREHAWLLITRLRAYCANAPGFPARPPGRAAHVPPRAAEWSNHFNRAGFPFYRSRELRCLGLRH